ncbi:MAG: NAD(P)/FAD-dependent oxidoreductase, partial [Deltaproteobacteria bacterium]|nr:NAD(P)/FAD-dependent oxidoreductase [Deltaproteobacteria bacterium]
MNFNVIIVGGGPAGIITALTAKNVYPEKSVLLIKEIGDGVIPCAIPYMMHTLSDPKQNVMGNQSLEQAGIEIKIGKVVSLDKKEQSITMKSGEVLFYGRLVLATGTDMVMPPIPGVDKEGVFSIQKSLSAMSALRGKVQQAKRVVIIGGGFIGAEFADELSKASDVEIHLIEILPELLPSAFDNEFCELISNELKN